MELIKINNDTVSNCIAFITRENLNYHMNLKLPPCIEF